MTDVFSLSQGATPLLISIPHDGRQLAPGMQARMTPVALALPDTDWHVQKLYAFAGALDVSVLSANYSRYVVDLNRPATDEALYETSFGTGLCPVKTFAGDDIYKPGCAVESNELAARVEDYWQPYHTALTDELARIKSEFGFALLWDAHSIPGEVPLLFDGALPDLNVGTNKGMSCSPEIERQVAAAAEASPFSSVLNGRFTGGHITRHFGQPQQHVHAIQLELAQRCYMDENTGEFDDERAARLTRTLAGLLSAFVEAATAGEIMHD